MGFVKYINNLNLAKTSMTQSSSIDSRIKAPGLDLVEKSKSIITLKEEQKAKELEQLQLKAIKKQETKENLKEGLFTLLENNILLTCVVLLAIFLALYMLLLAIAVTTSSSDTTNEYKTEITVQAGQGSNVQNSNKSEYKLDTEDNIYNINNPGYYHTEITVQSKPSKNN